MLTKQNELIIKHINLFKFSHNVIIVDGNPYDRTKILTQVNSFNIPGLIVKPFENINDAALYMLDKLPDLIIIDPLTCLNDGFLFLKSIQAKLKNGTIELLIVTAKPGEKTVLKIKNLPGEFLQKPYTNDEFLKRFLLAFMPCVDKKITLKGIKRLQKGSDMLSNREKTKRYFFFEIVFIESVNSKVIYYFKDGTNMEVTKTLTRCQEELEQFGFYRTSQSFIVNIIYVDGAKLNEQKVFLKYYPKIVLTGGSDKQAWETFYFTWERLR